MPALKHRVLITDPTTSSPPGEQDDDTGAFVDDPSSSSNVIYDGRGLFLDQGVTVERTDSGLPTVRADGQIILSKKSVGKFGIKEDMLVKITYPNGDEVDMSILKAVRFSDIVYVIRA